MKCVFSIAALAFSLQCLSQKDSVYSPTTLQEMFSQMDQVLSPSRLKSIKELSEDSIRRTNRYTSDLTDPYNYYNSSKLITDLEEKGLSHEDKYYLIIISYHRYLNKRDWKLDEQFRYYDSLRTERIKLYETAILRDSVDGKYIPANLEDCFLELDKILSDSSKNFIREKGTRRLHMTLGMYLRNRWQLWGAARLKKYFLDLSWGFMHPDSMSTVILTYYEKWLNGDRNAWREWEKEQKKMFKE
jgi:hypothetical protein